MPEKKKYEVATIVMAVMGIGTLILGVYMLYRAHQINKEIPGIKMKKSEIEKQYKEMCDFYLDTASVTVVKQKEYLLKTFKKYLKTDTILIDDSWLIRKWLWEEDKEFLFDFISGKVGKKKTLKIKAELIRRRKLIVKIQKILENKLKKMKVESEDYLARFVDGRFGDKTTNLAEAILRSTSSGKDWYMNSSFLNLETIFRLDKSDLSSLFKFLEKGKLKVIAIKLSKSTKNYINTLQKEIKKHQVTAENKKNKEGEVIKQKIKQAMDFINLQKKELLKSSRSEKEKIEKGRALMLVAVNYLVKSWEGFSAGTRHGWARYPYDKRGKSDYRYEKIDCSTYIKRIMETLFPKVNERYSWIAQPRPIEGLKLYAEFLGIDREEGKATDEFDKNRVFMVDGRKRHMRLMFTSLENDVSSAIIKISEASGGKVVNRLLIKGNDADRFFLMGTVNVSSTPVIKKWLSNN